MISTQTTSLPINQTVMTSSTNIMKALFCGLLDIILLPIPNKQQQQTDIYTREKSVVIIPESDTQRPDLKLVPSHGSGFMSKLHRQSSAKRSGSMNKKVQSVTRSDIKKPSTHENNSARSSRASSTRRLSKSASLSSDEEIPNVEREDEHMVRKFDPIQENSQMDRSYTNMSGMTNDSNFYQLVLDGTPDYS